jgi:hypothetical protein
MLAFILLLVGLLLFDLSRHVNRERDARFDQSAEGRRVLREMDERYDVYR